MAAHDQPPNRRQGPCVVYAIACGYPDADDLDDLSCDPAFKLACGRLPESGDDLASQPTVSRWENAPDMRTLLRLGYAMIDLWCQGYRRRPKHITLDIDDTVDVVHGHQQLSLFNAHYDERCFLPIHVYDADRGHCVAVLLRPVGNETGTPATPNLLPAPRRPETRAATQHSPAAFAAGAADLGVCMRCPLLVGEHRDMRVGAAVDADAQRERLQHDDQHGADQFHCAVSSAGG